MKKTKKRKRSTRMHGRGMGTHGYGSRKKHKKSGHYGGGGMSGSGKRADHKKTLVQKLYGHGYFGKQGITSRGTKKDKRKRINLSDIELNLERYVKQGVAKKTGKGFEVNLSSYKILGEGEVKQKLLIKALSASKSTIEKIKEKGGDITLLDKKRII
ncbi:uL15 family ribosomal protein [Candidatus Pacearchaeota archaeon]|nr:uL15 family ribosomal protein [Candidatus Pacearchaeota archaeon]